MPSPVTFPWKAGGYLVAVVAASLLLLQRQTGVPSTNSVWAEDGRIYYQDAATMPFLKTLGTPYSGYVQVFPRIVVQLTRPLPVSDAAAAMAVLGAVAVAGLALLVFHAARGHVRSPLLRALLVLTMLLLPIAPAELIDNLVNVPWWLLFASFWMILWRPTSWRGRAIAAIVCFLATASDPLVGLLLPLLLLRMIALRQARDHLVTVGFLAGLAIQLVIRLSTTQPPFNHAPLPSAVKQLGIRVGFGWVGGRAITDDLVKYHSGAVAVIGLLILAALTLLGISVRDDRVRTLAIITAPIVALLFLVPVYLRWTTALVLPFPSVENGSRYASVPILIVLSFCLVLLDATSSGLRSRRLVAVAFVAILLPAWVLDFRFANGRTDGPRWDQQVEAAAVTCPSSSTGVAVLQISPPGAGWSVRLPCREMK